jgi:hypothetical protein
MLQEQLRSQRERIQQLDEALHAAERAAYPTGRLLLSAFRNTSVWLCQSLPDAKLDIPALFGSCPIISISLSKCHSAVVLTAGVETLLTNPSWSGLSRTFRSCARR